LEKEFSLTGLYHCFILPKQFKTLCQLKNEENDPNLIALFETAGRHTKDSG
jgi:hypothetical protein